MLASFLRTYLTRSLSPFRFEGKHANTLDYVDLDDLGLYVHLPFCRSLCSFCPYCKVVYEKEIAQAYLQALKREIDLVGKSLVKRKAVTSLYFGGGSPALLVGDLASIIAKLEEYFLITKGIGIELHPDDITVDNLKKLKDAGITMVSLGFQSFNEKCLANLGRTGHDFITKLELVKAFDFAVVDVDLIFAIPGQTIDKLIADVELAFQNGATQISTYPFIDFTFANNRYQPLPESVKKQMLTALVQYCREQGKERTAVWTFANRETERYSSITRHNFLGFGVSATTLLQDQFKINTFSLDAYTARVESEQLPTSLTLDFTKRQRAAYFLFWSAYSMGLSIKDFEAVVGASFEKMFGFEFWLLEKIGLIYRDKGKYWLTDKAAYYYHYLEQAYTAAYIDKMWNISRVEDFPDLILLK